MKRFQNIHFVLFTSGRIYRPGSGHKQKASFCMWIDCKISCVCDRTKSIFKNKTWKCFFSPFATMLQTAVSSPSVFMLFLQYLFKQHILKLKMSHGSLIPGNSFHPILALAPFSLVLDELLLVLGLDKLAFVVNLIMLPRETYGDSPTAFMSGS